MDLVKKLNDISPRKRLYIMVVLSVLLTMLTYHSSTSSEVAGASSPATAPYIAVASNDSGAPAMPVGYQPYQQVTRDPFTLPPQFQSISNSAFNTPKASYQPSSTSSNIKAASVNLKLTGIAGANGKRVAVIQTDNKSKSYQLNEVVGGYKIIAITDTSVALAGPGGKRILNIEAANYKGGTQYAP